MKHITLLLLLLISSIIYSQESSFVIKDKKATITLTLENNATEIELNKETRFTISTVNIDIRKTAVIGRGIRILHDEKAFSDNYIQCTTTIDEKAVIDGKYKILLSYRARNKNKTYTFWIPVKVL
ncbi:hypothetical protein [Flavobacterium koreense]